MGSDASKGARDAGARDAAPADDVPGVGVTLSQPSCQRSLRVVVAPSGERGCGGEYDGEQDFRLSQT